jgi:hypothetical protein
MSPLAFSFSSNNSTELGDFGYVGRPPSFSRWLFLVETVLVFSVSKTAVKYIQIVVPNKFSYLANR